MKNKILRCRVLGAAILVLTGLPLPVSLFDTITSVYAASSNSNSGGNGHGNGGVGNGNGKGNGDHGYAVPEPDTLPFLCLGMGGVVVYALRRRSRNDALSR